ncbi:MAG: tape measure protein [Proteobacteria bacterium]|nr:tape measure protein [Pseudomonadota bacterium]
MTDIRAQVIIDGDPRGLRSALAQSEADLAKLDATGRKVQILEGAIQNAKDARAAMQEARASAQTLDEQLASAKGAGAGKEAIKLLEQAVRSANAEVKASEAAWDQSRQKLDSARAAASAAGVDTRNLAAEQGRLKTETEAAAAAVARSAKALQDAAVAAQEKIAQDRAAAAEEQRLAQIVEASIQRQKMAAQELLEADRRAALEAQGNANKIAASQREAALAAEALNNAFKQLGVRPLQEVVAETKRLQDALAQVRASGVTSAEQQQAIAAFQVKLAALKAEAHGVAPEMTNAGNAVKEFSDKTESMTGVLGGAVHNLAAMAGAVVGLQGLTGLAKDVISTGAAFEMLEGRLTSLLGSTDAAKDAFAQIKELAKTTPFEVQGLTEAYVKLTAFGLQPSMKQMQAIADTAATLGGGTEALSRVTLALGQAWTKSKLQGDEILQLAEAGVPVWDLLAKATGKNTEELQKMSEAGTLGRNVILKLIDALGQENMGASAQLMDTFSGAVSNAHDALDEFYALIAQSGVLEYLTGQVKSLLEEFDRMKANGELKDAAKEIADNFVKMAEGVKTAIEAVSAMSGVIKIGVEGYIAWRVAGMTLIPMLSGVGTAAATAAVETRAMGAAAAVTAVETRALGAASATAAPAVGLLANGIRLLKGLTLVGIVTEVASLGAEFFRAKAAAEEADKVLQKALAPSPINGPAKEFELVATNAAMTRVKTEELAQAFYTAEKAGKATAEALSDALKGAKFDPTGISDMIRGLDQVQGSARATGEEIRAALVDRLKSLSANDLADFAKSAEFAFGRGKLSAEQLAFAIDAQLDAALLKAGVTASTAMDGMTGKFRDSAQGVQILTSQLDVLAAKGVDTDRVFIDLITKTLPQAAGRQEFKFLADQVEAFGTKAGLAQSEVSKLLEAIRQKSESALPGIQSLDEAFEKLGMKSRTSLQQTEQAAKEAFEYIKANGGTIAEQAAAWDKYAAAAKAAHGGILPPMLQAQQELYKIGEAGRAAGKGISDGMATGSNAVNKMRSDAERLADRLASLKTAGLSDTHGNQSMGGNGTYDDLRKAGVTPQQMQSMGYSSREIEDYINGNDRAAPGFTNRTVTSSAVNTDFIAAKNGLSAEEAAKLKEIYGYFVEQANVDAAGRAAGSQGLLFSTSDYAAVTREYEDKAVREAKRLIALEKATASNSSASNTSSSAGNGFQFGTPGIQRTVRIEIADRSQTSTATVLDDGSAEAIIRALQTAKGS